MQLLYDPLTSLEPQGKKPAQLWAGGDSNHWQPIPGATHTGLPPGLYKIAIQENMFGPPIWALSQVEPKHDTIIEVGATAYILNQIKAFTAAKAKYSNLGLLHKRGFLLHGAPGTGKSLAGIRVCIECAKQGAYSIFATDPNITAGVLHTLRALNPDTLIVCLWEDIDWHLKRYNREIMTSLLDGENQIGNVVHIAITNFFETIEPAFANRPSRFDDIIEVGPPDYATRLTFLKAIVPSGDPAKIEELAKQSEGLILSHIKECIVAVFILNHDIIATVTRMNGMVTTAAANAEAQKEAAEAAEDDD